MDEEQRTENKEQKAEATDAYTCFDDRARQIAQVTTFLRRDVLRNIVPLKLLHAHHDEIGCFYAEGDASAAVLLLLPTRASPFDAATYPATDYVVLFAANDTAAGRALLDRIPAEKRMVFKLPGDAERTLIEQRFALRRVTAYISYTWMDGGRFPRWDDVVVTGRPDERCLALYEQQGHERDWVRRIFAAGEALAFTLYRDELPAATCFAFRNFEHIWEIGGLYTLPAGRRKGLGRRVVETALHELAARDLAPRYVIHEDNQPSRRLAEAVGLRAFVTTTHFLADPAAPAFDKR